MLHTTVLVLAIASPDFKPSQGDNLYWGKTSYVGIKYSSCERSLGCLSTMVVWFIVCITLDNDRALTSAKSGTTNWAYQTIISCMLFSFWMITMYCLTSVISYSLPH